MAQKYNKYGADNKNQELKKQAEKLRTAINQQGHFFQSQISALSDQELIDAGYAFMKMNIDGQVCGSWFGVETQNVLSRSLTVFSTNDLQQTALKMYKKHSTVDLLVSDSLQSILFTILHTEDGTYKEIQQKMYFINIDTKTGSLKYRTAALTLDHMERLMETMMEHGVLL